MQITLTKEEVVFQCTKCDKRLALNLEWAKTATSIQIRAILKEAKRVVCEHVELEYSLLRGFVRIESK